MKKIIVLLTCMLVLSFTLQAQISNKKSGMTIKNQTLKETPGLTYKSNVELLPDLKFTALNVTAAPYLDNGVTKYRLNITYTIKNDGTGPVLCDNVTIQAYITTEAGLTKDLSFTSYFTPAGGHILSGISGETLASGASKQFSFTPGNFDLQKDSKPIYLVLINPYGGAKESDTSNNRASMSILF
jgi:hypothetical protein